MANNPSGQLSKLEGHKQSAGPDLPGFKNKSMGEVSGNRPHHSDVRSKNEYNASYVPFPHKKDTPID